MNLQTKIFRNLSIMLIALMFASCATKVNMDTNWVNPEWAKNQYQRVLVIGVADRDETRIEYEDTLAGKLKESGITAIASYSIFPAVTELEKDAIDEVAKQNRYDAIVMTTLVSLNSSVRTVQERTYFERMENMDYYDHFESSRSKVTEPGYVVIDTDVVLETNMFDVKNGMLVWTGRSTTMNSQHVGDGIPTLASEIVNALSENQIIGN